MVGHAYHFVTLQHGYYGTPKDLSYFAKLLRQEASSSTTLVILEPAVNSWSHTGDGIIICGERLANFIIKRVEDTLASRKAAEKRPVKADGDGNLGCSDGSNRTASTIHLHFSFVAHSMGGLIVRAALPLLLASLRKSHDCGFTSEKSVCDDLADREGSHKDRVEVHWETFCTIATPHAGARHMPSRVKVWVVNRFVRISPSLRDMFLVSNTLTDTLLQDHYLDSWKAFKRRILVGVLGDQTVMSYSSVFSILSNDQASLRVHKHMQKKQGPYYHAISENDSAALPVSEALPLVSEREELISALASGLSELTPERWPVDILQRERAIAERIIERVGPFEHCLVDFSTRLVKHFGGSGFWNRMKVRRFGHRAIICRYPCNNLEIFGFVCEYIAKDVVIQSVEQTCPLVELALPV